MKPKFKVGDKVIMYRFYDEDDDNYKTDVEEVMDDFRKIYKNKTVLTIKNISNDEYPIAVKETDLHFKKEELKLLHMSWRDKIED